MPRQIERRLYRMDRRYSNPVRLTSYGRVRLWIIYLAVIVVVALGLATRSMFPLFSAGLAYAGILTYRRIRNRNRARFDVPDYPPAGLLSDEPLGERHSRVILQDVRIAVAIRDGGRCRQCGAMTDLQFDHVIPHSRGGANTVRNVQLLCGDCNRRKGDQQ
jgi:hypothetical protein